MLIGDGNFAGNTWVGNEIAKRLQPSGRKSTDLEI